MAPQAPTTKATSSRQADITDTSITDINSSTDIEWLRENMQQLMDNQVAMKEQLDKQRHQPVKMPLIKKFNKN